MIQSTQSCYSSHRMQLAEFNSFVPSFDSFFVNSINLSSVGFVKEWLVILPLAWQGCLGSVSAHSGGLRPGSNTCFSENTIFYLNRRSCYQIKIKLGRVMWIAKFYRSEFKNSKFAEKCASTHAWKLGNLWCNFSMV